MQKFRKKLIQANERYKEKLIRINNKHGGNLFKFKGNVVRYLGIPYSTKTINISNKDNAYGDSCVLFESLLRYFDINIGIRYPDAFKEIKDGHYPNSDDSAPDSLIFNTGLSVEVLPKELQPLKKSPFTYRLKSFVVAKNNHIYTLIRDEKDDFYKFDTLGGFHLFGYPSNKHPKLIKNIDSLKKHIHMLCYEKVKC